MEKPNDATEKRLEDIGKKVLDEAGAVNSCSIPIASEWTLDTVKYMLLEDFENNHMTGTITPIWKWVLMRKKLPKHLGIDPDKILELTVEPLEERLVNYVIVIVHALKDCMHNIICSIQQTVCEIDVMKWAQNLQGKVEEMASKK